MRTIRLVEYNFYWYFSLFSAIAQVAKHNQAKFRALSNMGDVLTKLDNIEEAVKVRYNVY